MEILYIKLISEQPILKMSLAADQCLLTSSYQHVVGRQRRPFVFYVFNTKRKQTPRAPPTKLQLGLCDSPTSLAADK